MEAREDVDPERLRFKPRLPKPATPMMSLFQGLKLMPEDLASSDPAAWSKVLEQLAPRQYLVLIGRHGLDGKPRRTLRALGERLRVTREWVRQIQERAHHVLRRRAVESGLIYERAPNRLSYSWREPYWPPGTVRGEAR